MYTMSKYSLVGIDGNAFAIMSYVSKAMKAEGQDKEQIDAYLNNARYGTYEHLLCVSAEMIDFLNELYDDWNDDFDDYDFEY